MGKTYASDVGKRHDTDAHALSRISHDSHCRWCADRPIMKPDRAGKFCRFCSVCDKNGWRLGHIKPLRLFFRDGVWGRIKGAAAGTFLRGITPAQAMDIANLPPAR